MRKTINNCFFYCFLLLIFWLPIPLGSNRPWSWAILEVVSFSLMASYCLYALKYRVNIQQKFRHYQPLLLMFFAVQCWLIIQLIPLPQSLVEIISPNTIALYSHTSDKYLSLSIDPSETLVSLYKGLAYFCLMLLTICLINSEQRLKVLLTVIVLSGTFQAVYGSLLALSGSPTSWVVQVSNNHIATGSFIYKNHFANFLLLCLSVGIGLLVAGLSVQTSSNSKAKLRALIGTLIKGKAVIRIALALMVIGLVLSKSRMGNAAFFVSMTLTGIVAFFYFKHRTKGLTYLLISLFVIDTFILGAWFGIDKVKERIEQTSFSQESRDEVNIATLELIKAYPIAGTGAGSFYTIFPSVKPNDITVYYDHTHNDYLQFAIEYGLPMTGLLACLVIASLWQSFYTIKHRRHNLAKGTAFGCMMAIIGMLIHISVDFNLQAPANAAYFVIILTLSWQSRYLFKKSTKQIK